MNPSYKTDHRQHFEFYPAAEGDPAHPVIFVFK
jgi:hypothetical protein